MEYIVMNLYDDPYALCACALISHNSVQDIYRIMVDDDFVKRLVAKETRLTDFQGFFLDTIVQGILEGKHRMEMMRELDKLSEYFFANLDLDRLRHTIKQMDILYGFGIFE